jgi:hypothetical protein
LNLWVGLTRGTGESAPTNNSRGENIGVAIGLQ